ncbi:hypothetical protein H6Y62_01020 [Staphylococcus lugdunensis]|uniref:Uncharacterized protein n=3 Tax=Staphylococcus TaxID=1279 RepID=A0A4Q9WC96_STALU|nr:hypothetical protein [Staphylococcus lugdunensis]EHS04517.1 hypothetical protein SEVCU139_1916 [Staphylococcus lugdunensis VCU139]KAK58356.1 hypothetical protein SLVCU150_0874 [Staphylococcus lugdunensis VCU150]KAK62172.1 hypothetical protein SLVCU148_1645 [Staphylococcus lugdunensis VCU148]OFM43056.1 hypothetical protein HMPREF2693_08295 [Staphylococcus sp. HMSC068D08]OFN51599.1 hypothetical protein HMPREF2552_10735 [Staphylococcus sp. HMSC062E10]OFN88580.1 hypothetical protein HMPREF2718
MLGTFMEILKIITPVLLASAVIATQYLLSRTGKKRFGLIIPIITLAVIVYMHITGILGLKLIGTILLTIIAELFLLGQWVSAQEDRKKKHAENESKDLKL